MQQYIDNNRAVLIQFLNNQIQRASLAHSAGALRRWVGCGLGFESRACPIFFLFVFFLFLFAWRLRLRLGLGLGLGVGLG